VVVSIYKLRPVVCHSFSKNNNNKLAKIRRAKLNIKQKQMLNLVMDIFVLQTHTQTQKHTHRSDHSNSSRRRQEIYKIILFIFIYNTEQIDRKRIEMKQNKAKES